MKKITVFLCLILVISLVACDSSSNKILGLIELGKSTRGDLEELNLQIEFTKVWDEAEGIYRYNYIWDYANYTLNNVNGTIRIKFTDDDTLAQFVNYSAKATSENKEQLMSYLTDTYGKSYEQVDDDTTRWVSEYFTIDYVLTDKETIEVR